MQSAIFKINTPTVISKVTSMLAVLTAMLIAFSVMSQSASAGTSILYNQSASTTKIYFVPNTKWNVKATVTNGTFGAKFTMVCWTTGQAMTGNYYSNKWFYGQYFSTGGYGYVHSSYVYYQTSVRSC